MNKRLKLLGIFITASLCCYAQTKEFDPSLDPNVTIVSRQSQEEWNSRYMWYPGQLAAFYLILILFFRHFSTTPQ